MLRGFSRQFFVGRSARCRRCGHASLGSVLLGKTRHHVDEVRKMASRIMRSGRGLGVILHANLPTVTQSLDGAVGDVAARQAHRLWQIGDGKAMVLARDHDAPSLAANRLVGAAMAKMKLERLLARRQSSTRKRAGRSNRDCDC